MHTPKFKYKSPKMSKPATRRSIKSFLKTTGVRPKRALGQNFLTSKAISQKIIAAAEVGPSDIILEIGPGLGSLTLSLAKKAKKVIAIEKDQNLSNTLKDMLEREKIENVEVLNRDVLNFQFSPQRHSEGARRPKNLNKINNGDSSAIRPQNDKIKFLNNANYKLVANLPYNIATAVIMKFLEAENPPELMVVMTQKEVGQRMCAKPPKMSKLAIFTQLYSQPKIVSYVSRKYFYPQPRVNSAILKIKPRIGQTSTKLFSKIVNAGFTQPRKQLINNLTMGLNLTREAVMGWLNKNNIKPTQRAECLSVNDWLKLADTFPYNL